MSEPTLGWYEKRCEWYQAEIERLRDRLRRAVSDGSLDECDVPECNCGGYHSRYASRMMEHAQELDELRDEIERLRADKRRLDWLERSHHNIEREDDEDGVHRVWCGPSHIAAGSVREAIDAAMGGNDEDAA